MLKQPYTENNPILIHTIVSHFLMNDTGEGG